MRQHRWSIFLLSLLVVGLGVSARAQSPRILRDGQLPDDHRLGQLRTLDGYFPFTPPKSVQEWTSRAERVRRQILVATGLWPMPPRTDPKAVIHGRVDRGNYTIEKVFFESYPGHFVTGNLYRPKGRSGRLPGVLSPHGHWANGRFFQADDKEIRRQLADGAERFPAGAKSPLQARCVQLARMGCVVFHYDMVGYADSVQLSHGPGYRPAMSTPENWGYFSPQAESRLQNMMGLQTYNSIRALDWFSELPDVDPARIAVTGCSGGGTQTFILSAIDRRPAVSFPAVMVSTAMQGGCTCENACYLRIGTGNIEFAALFAPRPLGMTAADDWTKEIDTKGLPELKQLWKLMGADGQVMARSLLQFPHNYNHVSRTVMYGWINKHLKLGMQEPVLEEDFQPLSPQELSVWDEKHPKPAGGDAYERELLRRITADTEQQLAALTPSDAASLARYRETVGGAVDAMIGRALPPAGAVAAKTLPSEDRGDYRLGKMLVRIQHEAEEVPLVLLVPKQWNRQIVVWLDGQGKQALFDAGKPRPAVAKLLASGRAVAGVDLVGQGEFTKDGKPLEKTGQVNPKYAGYTFGYNAPVFVQRVHDVLTVISWLKHGEKADRVSLVGLGGAGPWAAAARAQAGEAIHQAAIDTAGWRFGQVAALDDPNFFPGGAKYFDLPGLLALSAPGALWLAGEGNEGPPVTKSAYRAAGRPEQLVLFAGPASQAEAAAVAWLTR